MPNSNQFFRDEINSIKNKEDELPALTITGSLSGSTKSFSLTPKQQSETIGVLESFNERTLSRLARATLNLFGISIYGSFIDTSAGNKTVSDLGVLLTEMTQVINKSAAVKTAVFGDKYKNEHDAHVEIADYLIKLFNMQLRGELCNTILGNKTKAEIGEYLTRLLKDESFQDKLISVYKN